MGIYEPVPKISDSDKRLILLLERLLLDDSNIRNRDTNLPKDEVSLSDREAQELFERLDDLASSRSFVEAAYFTEAITRPEEGGNAREIYLSGRRRAGKTRVLASKQWSDFRGRIGLPSILWPRPSVFPMEFSYFEKMERRLLSKIGLSQQVIELVLSLLRQHEDSIEDIRSGQKSIQRGLIREAILFPLRQWRSKNGILRDYHISSVRLTALITVVADTSVMFTTRDWGVAGTLSTMAGALATVISSDDKS